MRGGCHLKQRIVNHAHYFEYTIPHLRNASLEVHGNSPDAGQRGLGTMGMSPS